MAEIFVFSLPNVLHLSCRNLCSFTARNSVLYIAGSICQQVVFFMAESAWNSGISGLSGVNNIEII